MKFFLLEIPPTITPLKFEHFFRPNKCSLRTQTVNLLWVDTTTAPDRMVWVLHFGGGGPVYSLLSKLKNIDQQWLTIAFLCRPDTCLPTRKFVTEQMFFCVNQILEIVCADKIISCRAENVNGEPELVCNRDCDHIFFGDVCIFSISLFLKTRLLPPMAEHGRLDQDGRSKWENTIGSYSRVNVKDTQFFPDFKVFPQK